MTTLIVGCGYLGRRAGRTLTKLGDRVLGTVRSEPSAASLGPWDIEPVLLDVLDPGSVSRLPDVDRLVYCVGFDRKAGVPMRDVYVIGLDAVLGRYGSGLDRVVYASSTGVYGRDDGGWVDEESETSPRHESGKICLEAEDRVRDFSARTGVRSVVLRYSGLYGPGRIVRKEAVRSGEVLIGDPGRWLNLIHIDDAASAAVAALRAASPGPLYVASDDRPVPRSEYYSAVAASLGAPEPRFRPPEPGSPEARREEANKRADNRRIKAELGLALTHPDIRSGVPASLAMTGDGPGL